MAWAGGMQSEDRLFRRPLSNNHLSKAPRMSRPPDGRAAVGLPAVPEEDERALIAQGRQGQNSAGDQAAGHKATASQRSRWRN